MDHKPKFLPDPEAKDFIDNSIFITYVDAFSRQIKELFFIDNHQYIGTDKKLAYASDDFKKYADSKAGEYIHVLYPWNHHLVKTVKADDYFKLKTNRNQDLITADEQRKLSNFNVAVLGMSVGSNIAFVLTQAGISKKVLLADFDELDTTNLNRILAGLHQVGVNKTIIASRRIYEDNPFAEVEILTEGVTQNNLEPYLKEGRINCIVEEIDDMPVKIHTRLLAMKYKVPVVMVTDNGDGVVLHVERYDLGCTTIWGKDHKYFEKKLAEGPMTRELAGQIIMNDIVGGPTRVDPKMLESVKRVLAKELVSWSQLGSAAILGGVVATYAIKKIALGEKTDLDLRSYITPESVIKGTHAS